MQTQNINYVLRLEGLLAFIISLTLYHKFGFSWYTYFTYILLPDIAFIAYLANSKIGAMAYNTTHTYIFPFLLLLYAVVFDNTLVLNCSLIWISHIGFDRALGYGLKYSTGFKFTHLGILGKKN